MISLNIDNLNCDALKKFLASQAYVETHTSFAEDFRKKHKIERRFCVERRVRVGRPLWGNHRSKDRRRIAFLGAKAANRA